MADVNERTGRVDCLLPESEFRYLFALLANHETISKTGIAACSRLLAQMGQVIFQWNAADSKGT